MSRFDVYLDQAGEPTRMGQTQVEERAGRTVRCEFTYDTAYLARPGRLALDPATPVSDSRWVSAELPRGLADAGPDGWGRSLLLRANRGRALAPSELLLAVDDTSRIGALRVRVGGHWESSGEVRVPALVQLAELQQAASQVETDTDEPDAVRRLVGGGSASLGGMRPKASVLTDEGRLAVAKFSSHRDEITVIAWEKACLDLAAKAGIPVPENHLLWIGGQPVLVLDRFDRTTSGHRLPYLSAFAITEVVDAASGDYLDIGEALSELDIADLPATLRQLWRRAAFNVAIRNTDDHLKNHAILWHGDGWRLSPAFDLTPDPVGGTPRATQIAGQDSPGSETRGLAELAVEFGISTAEQRAILDEILTATGTWPGHATGLGIPGAEIRTLQRPFDEAHSRLATMAGRLDG